MTTKQKNERPIQKLTTDYSQIKTVEISNN